MNDVTTLYDDLVSIRRAAAVLPPTTGRETRDDLEVVFARIEGKLAIELQLLTEDQLDAVLDSLDIEYDGLARVELESLM